MTSLGSDGSGGKRPKEPGSDMQPRISLLHDAADGSLLCRPSDTLALAQTPRDYFSKIPVAGDAAAPCPAQNLQH